MGWACDDASSSNASGARVSHGFLWCFFEKSPCVVRCCCRWFLKWWPFGRRTDFLLPGRSGSVKIPVHVRTVNTVPVLDVVLLHDPEFPNGFISVHGSKDIVSRRYAIVTQAVLVCDFYAGEFLLRRLFLCGAAVSFGRRKYGSRCHPRPAASTKEIFFHEISFPHALSNINRCRLARQQRAGGRMERGPPGNALAIVVSCY
jgi:hypothetical protein